MKSIILKLPEDTNETEVRMIIAATLFDKGIFSGGQAAEFVGITKREFIETVGKYEVSVFGETLQDFKG